MYFIKKFEQFVSEVYDNHVNESFKNDRLKLKEIFKEHGQPKAKQSDCGTDKKILYEIENFEIVDIIDVSDNYIGGDYYDENETFSDGSKAVTFMVELEDGCGIVVKCGIVDYFDKKLGITLEDIKNEFIGIIDELVEKVKNGGYEIDNYSKSEYESETGFTINGDKCIIKMEYNSHWGDGRKSHGSSYNELVIDVEKFEIEIDNCDIYIVTNDDFGITHKTNPQLFLYEEEIEVGVYNEYERNGVKPSDFY
jgi:hypothetical protein